MVGVHKISHPIVNAELSKLRLSSTSSKEFREGINHIALILGLEASKDLEEVTFDGQTPIAAFKGTNIKPRVGLTPILRAGLGMTDALLTLFPSAPVYHLGIFREKVTLQPVEYYSKLPAQPPVDIVYLLDPLIATGGTAVAALTMIVDWGIPVDKIKLLCVLASQEGLKNVQSGFPGLEIWVAGIDETLTKEGLISPGLGDTGDRLFNTLRP
ncbi:armadillo/beta-catenin/plakoglobin [Lentinula edodes]|uniref:uracil phosphoribosyltransferase n=1 Tax=Lentinula lateritia TaxID=40482 RepID=A0A9W9DRI8_9AGAR|nr:armadillo/beta-catenin/plakoglobin [Lentinula edodes]KAJ3892925.1 armadillo/beta-catenin/plakoglobin [Lentinula edodes]KAJ4481385.1 armadillo/beta-catenin/plakoglobin [Lentinula edodes]